MRTNINRCIESREHDLQRKAIRQRQLWKVYDHIGEMVMVATWMGEHSYCEKSGGVPTMGCQVAPVVAEGSAIAIRGGTVVAVAVVG